MGLFSHLPPNPIVSFSLDSRRPFGPGSRVSGYLTLQVPPDPRSKVQPPPPRQLNDAQITFYGHAATANTRTEHNSANNSNTTIHYKDDINLFRQSYALICNVLVEETKPLQCSFGFSFPYASDALPSAPYYRIRSTASGTYSESDHAQQNPLPPSFSLGSTSSSDYAVVEYTIEVVCTFEGEKEPLTVRLETPLDFLPLAPVTDPSNSWPPLAEYANELKRFSSSRLVGAEKSFSHSLRDKFSSKTPSVDVLLKVTAPTTLVPGSSFPIYACLEVLNPTTTGINLSVAEIKVKSLRCCQYVFYRAVRKYGGNNPDSHEASSHSTVVLNTIPESQWVDQRDRLVAEKGIEQHGGQSWYYPATFEARIPGDTGLSLRTTNIDCGYCLELKLEAEICGKVFDLKKEVAVTIVQASV